ncbi:hypothetical protein, partial [Microbacterium sp.]|uniref:hypothetical protein n=1 Tax=Microbacterium sp. TaxID=51671 RepID=UPI003C7766BA
RSEAAVAALDARAPSVTGSTDAGTGTDAVTGTDAGTGAQAALDVPGIAQSWLATGYPIEGLDALAAADPAVAHRVITGIRRDLAR